MRKNRLWILLARQMTGEISPEELRELNELIKANPDAGYPMDIVSALWGSKKPENKETAEDAFAMHLPRMKSKEMDAGPKWASAKRKNSVNYYSNFSSMFANHFKIAWRNLIKNRQSTFLNLMGLATGITCTLLIYLWVNDELQIDKFHANDSRLFQVMERQQINDNTFIKFRTAGLVAQEMAHTMPEVEYAVPVMHYSWFPKFLIYTDPDHKVKAVGQFAGKDFFHVFSYGLMSGNANTVLVDKNSIVLSESMARRLFNTTDNIIGKVLKWEAASLQEQVVVTGVFKDIPARSSQQFDFVLSFEYYRQLVPSVADWNNDGTNTYVVLKQRTNLQEFNSKISGFIRERSPSQTRFLFLKRFSDIYLHGKYDNGVEAGGRIEYVRLFSIVALFILIIACINFMNLTTARAAGRLKEIGVKKAAGASRTTLIAQFLGESLLLAFIALFISIGLILLMLPRFNEITGKDLSLQLNVRFIVSVLSIAFITGLISGSYPALYLSRFKAAAVLKGGLKTSISELLIRKGLVVFQFTLSVVFIIATMVVYRQINLIETTNLGYSKDNIIYFEKEGKLQNNFNSFLSESNKIPGVLNVSSIDRWFSGSSNTTGAVDWQGKAPKQTVDFEIVRVDYGMTDMLDIVMKAGRSFSRSFGSDSSKVVFNEAAIDAMGLKDPIGKTVKVEGKDMQIIGVAINFHFESLHETVKPLFIVLDPGNTLYEAAKIAAGKENEAISGLKGLYESYNQGSPFDYKFLDQDYQALYVAEKRVATLSRYFAALAIVISCLGLFGLAAFTAQKRQKEIGIRKVMGATSRHVMVLLASDLLKLIMIAMLVAFPLAWWISTRWLNDFAYRIDIGVGPFLMAGAFTFAIALLTITFQLVKAALANPVVALRSVG